MSLSVTGGNWQTILNVGTVVYWLDHPDTPAEAPWGAVQGEALLVLAEVAEKGADMPTFLQHCIVQSLNSLKGVDMAERLLPIKVRPAACLPSIPAPSAAPPHPRRAPPSCHPCHALIALALRGHVLTAPGLRSCSLRAAVAFEHSLPPPDACCGCTPLQALIPAAIDDAAAPVARSDAEGAIQLLLRHALADLAEENLAAPKLLGSMIGEMLGRGVLTASLKTIGACPPW
jgi:hypothetical protein